MSPTTDVWLEKLAYDRTNKTASLSAATRGFSTLTPALTAAFGESGTLTLSKVILRDPPDHPTSESNDWVCIEGKARVYGYTRDVYLELSLTNGELVSLLILVPLAKGAWKLTKGFADFAKVQDFSNLALNEPWVVISAGLGGVGGSRRVGSRTLDLQGQDLQDGLQIVSKGLVNRAGLLTEELWKRANAVGLPDGLQPDRASDPDRVVVRGNLATKAVVVELWWPVTGPEGMPADGLHATGIGLRYHLDPPAQQLCWLWELGGDENPVVLEAGVYPGFPLRYHTRIGAPAPLGETIAALSRLIGTDAQSLLPAPPEHLNLLSMTYAPRRTFELVVAAGDRRASGPHLVTVGPIELREVSYAIAVTLGGPKAEPQIVLEARAAFFGVDFAVCYAPGVRIEGGLADPDGVRLGALIESALPVTLPFGLDTLTLRTAWVRRMLGDSPSTHLKLEVDGEVRLLPTGAITLKAIRFAVDRPDSNSARYAFGATFGLGPLQMRIDAAQTEAGWLLSGYCAPENGLSLTDLIDHLVHAFGAEIPPEVPDILLESVELQYETNTKTLLIKTMVGWTLDENIPVLAGNHTVMLGIQVAAAPAGGRQANLTLDWTLEKGANTLAASVYLSREQQVYAVDLSAPDKPLRITELVHELGLPADTSFPGADVLDIVLQVSHLSVNYTRPPGVVDLAWSRPLGNGMLVTEVRGESAHKNLQICWVGATPEAALGLKTLLDATSAGGAVDEVRTALSVVGMGGMVNDVIGLLTFHQLGFQWDHSSAADDLLFTARSVHVAVDRCFLLVRRGGAPGIVTGLTLREGAHLSQLPFVPELVGNLLEATTSLFGLELTQVLFSTLQAGRFSPPGFQEANLVPSFGQTGIRPASRPFGTAAMPLGRGFALGGRITLSDDPNNPIRRVLNFDHIDAQVTFSAQEVGIQAVLPGSLKIDAGGGTSLELRDAMFRVEMGESGPAMDVGGSLDLMLFHKHLHADGWLSISTHSLEGHIGIYGIEFPPPPMLPGVHFTATEEKPFYLDVGLQFEPPGLMMGMKGHFYIQTSGRRYEGDVTFVLEIVEIIPQPLYVEFEIDALNIPCMVEAMTGVQWALAQAEHLADEANRAPGAIGSAAEVVEGGIAAIEGAIAHLNDILDDVSLNDVRIRWCDSVVNLPDGTLALPGVGFRGEVSLFGWDAFALLEFSSGGIPNLTGHFEAEPIHIGGVIEIWGDGKGIRNPPKSPGDLSPSTTTADPGEWFLEPGGPVFHVSTRSSPFLHADLHARLFGFLAADVHAEVTTTGFCFSFHLGAGPLTADLDCHYWKDDGAFEASGALGLHLHGDIGPIIPGIEATKIHLNTDLGARVQLRVDSTGFVLELDGEFNFQGLRINLPTLTLIVAFSSIADLAKAIWDHIVDLAEEIFEEVLLPIKAFFEDAAKAVAEVATKAVEAVEAVAIEVAGEIKQIAEVAVDAVEKVAEEVWEQATIVAQAAAKLVSEADQRAREAAQPLHHQADRLRAQKGNLIETTANQVAAIALDVAGYVKEVALVIADLAGQAARWVADRFDEARRWVEGRLADAAAAVVRLANEAAEYCAQIDHEIRLLIAEIEELGRKIKAFFEDLGHDIKHGFEEVGHAFKSAFSGW